MKPDEELIRKLVRMADETDSAITQVVAEDGDGLRIGAIVVLDGEDTGRILDRINAESDAIDAEADADAMLDDFADTYLRGKLREGKTRRDFAVIAANIADDRYGAGSSAALATIYILLRHGLRAARDFAADLRHHER